MQNIISQRLIIRPLVLSDAEFVIKQFNEPDCLRYIGERHIHNVDDAQSYIINGPQASYLQHGFGMMIICLKSENIDNDFSMLAAEPIGLCGLLKRDHLLYPDLGYAILSRFYKQGYASEATQAILDNYPDQKQILALTDIDNYGSQAVLGNLGFKWLETKTPEDGSKRSNIYQLIR